MKPNTTPFWINDAFIVTQNSKRQIISGAIRVANGIITDIVKGSPRLKKGDAIYSANGTYILPGFIHAHMHLCQTLFRNAADDLELLDWLKKRIWVMEAAHTAETLYTSAKLGIYELLSGGSTCILDMGTVRHTDSIIKAAKKYGIRGSFGKCLMDHPKTTPANLREKTEVALQEAVDLYHRHHGAANGRIRISFAPRFVVSCTEELLSEVARISAEFGMLVHTHASENRKEIELVRKMTGKDNIDYLHSLGLTGDRLVLAHCVWLTEREKITLKKTGTHVAHCPSSNLKLASGIAPVEEYLKRGISVALGADGAPCNNRLNAFQEMRLAAFIQKPQCGPRALNAQTALDLMTLGGARALGWQDEIGSLEIGKKADFSIIDLNQPENAIAARGPADFTNPERVSSSLVYSADREHVRATFVDGNLLFTGGKVRGIPLQTLKSEADQARKVVFRQAGFLLRP